MSSEQLILIGTAASIGFFHTLFGPDHYIPFIMMARAKKWSYLKTLWVTFYCGIGHVLSSVLLGAIGILFAISILNLESIESMRGDFAAWMLVIFGLSYFIWSLHRLLRGKAGHTHLFGSHKHAYHDHDHAEEHDPDHEKKETTPWILFVIFVLGPCEALIPLLMYPAARHNYSLVFLVTLVFGLVTILTMMAVVLSGVWGLSKIRWQAMEKYIHPISGFVIFLSGMAILFLGL
ncbi:MAG TPA: hypothetical protein ENJ10_07835 [Caldithrix abyssi]|uniref:Urease accessory protein UreH-like transmembrane domain-containing protein n=1 Tax=Caldithrix abyssi TaxID=187145 RepID=A0A7V1LMB6_CALAY|nr:hypothetical protein [Caldithrix abyssi]